ncbi:MAG: lipid A deacylase LpxR family protein [Burkholderiales bacterium]|nr:lipid A deacylase LpxR family protein [Burkholderiales bacterium]
MAAALALQPTLAIAQADADIHPPCPHNEQLQWRGGSLRLENDLFAGTDHNYTNGVALTWVSRDIAGALRSECMPAPLALYTRFIAWADPQFRDEAASTPATQNLVVRIGQAMYTPTDKKRTDRVIEDRPYAGLLYLGMSWNRRLPSPTPGREMLETRELSLGVIGPASLAEQTQDLVHRARGIERFRGWQHQLHNEPAFQLAMERKFKHQADGAIRPGWGSDAIGSYALRIGNIETAASAGVELRSGWNLPNDFGSYPIRPGAENRPPSAAAAARREEPRPVTAPRPGAHVFASLEAKAVAWDFSLDGNLFGGSHRVERRPWVAQAAIGFSGQWLLSGHGLRLALMRVWRTREFERQTGGHAFGSVALSLEY